VISGLGGVGKSQTAIKYAHRYAKPNDSYEQCYDWAFWVKADTDLNLESDFAAIAHHLNLAQTGQTNPELAQAAKHWLETTSDRWLLIFDNADTLSLLKPYRCQNPQGHTLLTSRADSFAVLGIRQPLALEVLSEAEAITFLWERTERVRPDRQTAETLAAVELAQELGYLPLALEQAAAYIAQKQTYFERYLPSYRKRQLQLLETHAPETGDYPLSVATTWQLNFEQVEQSNPAAADVLRLSAFLAADDIPCELLVRGAANLGEAIATALKDFQEDPVVLDEVLSALTQYSLIRRNPEAFCYSLHRLVQLVQRHNMSAEERTLWCDRLVEGLNDTFPYVEFENWKYCERFILHIADLWTHQPTDSLSWTRVLHFASYYLHCQGRFETAIMYSERSLQIRKIQLGEVHLDTATSFNNLALLYKEMGRYSIAEELHLKALQVQVKLLGESDPAVAVSLNNLAEIYHAQGHYNKAVQFHLRALDLRLRFLEKLRQSLKLELNPSDSLHSQIHITVIHIAASFNGLAALYVLQGLADEAENFYQKALQMLRQFVGEIHPHIATTLNGLAELYRIQKKYSKAEPLHKQALQLRQQLFNELHPDVATSLNNLALLHTDQGQYSEAEPLYLRVLQIQRQLFGENHRAVANTLNNLAALYAYWKHFSEAELHFMQALKMCQQILGKEHPDTIHTCVSLAGLYSTLERYSEAEPLYLQALDTWMKYPSERNFYTQRVWNDFYALIQQVVESDRTQDLSSHPITQALLQQIREAGAE
jgi:tetratricopeptide (TPR) repeat protein